MSFPGRRLAPGPRPRWPQSRQSAPQPRWHWKASVDCAGRCAASLLSRWSDHRFGLCIEKVQALRVQRQSQALVNIDPDAGVDRGHHRVRTDGDVEENFRAELLDNLDRSVKTELGRVRRRGHMQILRPDAQDNLLVDITAEPGCRLAGRLDAQTFILDPQRAVGTADPDFLLIHPRPTEKPGDKE